MTRSEIISSLAAIEQALSERIEIWRDVVDEKGNILYSIYRGSFQHPRGSHIGEPQQGEPK